ncbi:chloride channel protein [Chitinophaga sp. sic0106]|uniref:chloride channel protein n=1 Tax=Chitinophaga sp. sic0106 TaxID=2854785 RepID=UPI001C43EBAE|nr:chloride channel protein [Chitinophaga sp. sic0106]MBV7528472.1 chloride channel protein [Chitinophaga sp. sic0106]
MYNRLFQFNSYRTPLFAPEGIIGGNTADEPPVKLIRICALALAAGLLGSALAFGIYSTFFLLGNLLYLGRFSFEAFDVYYSGIGYLIILLPILTTTVWFWGKQKNKPGYQLMLVAMVSTGAPLGFDAVVVYFNSLWIARSQKRYGLSVREMEILTVTAVAGALTWCFGTPLAAIACCIELFLAELSLVTVLPLLISVGITTFFQYHGNPQLYELQVDNSNEYTLLWLYGIIGIVCALLAGLYRYLYLRVQTKFTSPYDKKKWLMLLPALVVGLAIWYYPENYGPGNNYLIPLLHGAVTFKVILLICFGRYLCSLIYSSTASTGASVTTLLIIGASWGLLTGFIFQLSFPHLHVSSTMIALAGMAAFLTGSTRAVLTALIFTIEMSHSAQVLPAVSIACAAAYGTTYLLTRRRKQILNPQLKQSA